MRHYRAIHFIIETRREITAFTPGGHFTAAHHLIFKLSSITVKVVIFCNEQRSQAAG